jgi:hypothetical protein
MMHQLRSFQFADTAPPRHDVSFPSRIALHVLPPLARDPRAWLLLILGRNFLLAFPDLRHSDLLVTDQHLMKEGAYLADVVYGGISCPWAA